MRPVIQIGYNPIESTVVSTYSDGVDWSETPIPGRWNVGSVEFCRAALGDREPAAIDYPEPIKYALKRRVYIADVPHFIRKAFVKPLRTKAFEARVIGDESVAAPGPFWWSEIVNFVAEWRVYFFSNGSTSTCRYDDGDEDQNTEGLRAWHFGLEIAKDWRASGQAPCAFALDVGLLDDGRMALVEANDFWALGFYSGCDRKAYTQSLADRWVEMTK
jgi:hypothetical protein